MDKFYGCGFAHFQVKYILRKITLVYFFSILANEEKNEGGEITG